MHKLYQLKKNISIIKRGKRCIGLMLACMLAVGVLNGCGNSETTADITEEIANMQKEISVENTEANNGDEVITEFGKKWKSEIVKENNETDNPKEWKQIYIDYLANVNLKSISTVLIDVNKDDIPELFCSWDAGVITYSIYYIDRTDTVQPIIDNWSHISILYGKNYIHVQGGHTGSYYNDVFKYNKKTGKFECKFDGTYYDYDENGNYAMIYTIGGASCTEDEYFDKLNKICDNVIFSMIDFDSNIVEPTEAIRNYPDKS